MLSIVWVKFMMSIYHAIVDFGSITFVLVTLGRCSRSIPSVSSDRGSVMLNATIGCCLHVTSEYQSMVDPFIFMLVLKGEILS
jgi:hypothetical protein